MNWLIGIWLLIGLFGWIFIYHSIRKTWYSIFKKEYWKSENKSALIILCIMSPMFIVGGLTTIFLGMFLFKKTNWCLNFNIKRYERKLFLKEFGYDNE